MPLNVPYLHFLNAGHSATIPRIMTGLWGLKKRSKKASIDGSVRSGMALDIGSGCGGSNET